MYSFKEHFNVLFQLIVYFNLNNYCKLERIKQWSTEFVARVIADGNNGLNTLKKVVLFPLWQNIIFF